MDIKKLHQGVVIRQVLSRKINVRLSFVPDDESQTIESTIRRNTPAERSMWSRFLGDDHADVDIDTGVLVVRFNREKTAGIAFFISEIDQSAPITHPFEQIIPPAAATILFAECMNRRYSEASAQGVQITLAEALSACGGFLFVEDR